MIVAHVMIVGAFVVAGLGVAYVGYRHFRKHDIVKPADVVSEVGHEVDVLEKHNEKLIDEVKKV